MIENKEIREHIEKVVLYKGILMGTMLDLLVILLTLSIVFKDKYRLYGRI